MKVANSKGQEPRLHLALFICIVLWIVYTVLYTLPLKDIYHAILEPLPGITGVITLFVTGFHNDRWYLRIAPISKTGLAVLGILCFILLAPLGPALLEGESAAYRGFSTHLYALTSGIGQELFFRAVLLPICISRLGGKWLPGTVLHAVLFSLWHIPKAYLTAPVTAWIGALAVGTVTTLAGLGWGWQVQKDKTIFWALTQHVVFLLIMSLFGL